MTRGALKVGQGSLLRAHFRTLVDARTGRPRVGDYFVFVVVPILAGIAAYFGDVRLTSGTAAGLLTATSLLGAFFFGVMLQIADRAMNWADTMPIQSRDTTKHARDLEELAANAGFSSLVCIAAAISFVVVSTTGHEKLRVASAVGITLGVMVVAVLLLVMRRVFNLTVTRLTRARTGKDRAQQFSSEDRERAGSIY
jgi:hypothetical protein